jgi:predicted permease
MAVLMLAFGIGATTAIFSMVEGVLLRPLQFPNSERLVALGDHLQGANWDEGNGVPVTAPEINTYAHGTHSFENVGGYSFVNYAFSGIGEPAQVNASRMTAGVFSTLGVAPLLGRVFTVQEDEQRQQVAVLSYATWKSRFQGNPQVLGTTILLDRRPYLVIGVMPNTFEFPLVPGHVNHSELWVPMSFTPQDLSAAAASSWSYHMVGRLKAGITPVQAQNDAELVAQEIMRNYPTDMSNIHINAVVSPLQEITVKAARPLLRILLLAVVVVLLIACANLAGLLLVRAIRKQREIALRLALGAPSMALLRQTVLESFVLSISGGLLGIGLAALALRVGINLLPESLPRINEIGLNWPVIGFAFLLAAITGLLCGSAPVFVALRTNMNSCLKEGGRSGAVGGNHTRLRSALVVVEIAVALILLTASGLLLRSFQKMGAVDLGFRPEHVTTASYSLPQKQYPTQPSVDAFNHELLLQLRRLPGAEAVGITSTLPISGDNGTEAFVADGYLPQKGAGMNLAVPSQVMGSYFQTMKISLLHGRLFTEEDRANTQLVVIVNHRLAEHYWPNQNPLGKRMRIGTQEMKTPWMTVVGELADVKLSSPGADASEQFYQPVEQAIPSVGSLASPADLGGNGGYIVLRSALPPEQMENALRATVHSIDPLLPLTQVQTMRQIVSDSKASSRFNTSLIISFAFAAMVLAVLGIYSVIAFSATSRAQEIAIRMALGSQRSGILLLIVISGAKLAAIGCVIGIAGAAVASGLLRSVLFGVSPFDPLVFTVAATTVLLLAVGASTLPALRATSIDPMRALRGE